MKFAVFFTGINEPKVSDADKKIRKAWMLLVSDVSNDIKFRE